MLFFSLRLFVSFIYFIFDYFGQGKTNILFNSSFPKVNVALICITNTPGRKTFPFHLDYIDASLVGNSISPTIFGTVAQEC